MSNHLYDTSAKKPFDWRHIAMLSGFSILLATVAALSVFVFTLSESKKTLADNLVQMKSQQAAMQKTVEALTVIRHNDRYVIEDCLSGLIEAADKKDEPTNSSDSKKFDGKKGGNNDVYAQKKLLNCLVMADDNVEKNAVISHESNYKTALLEAKNATLKAEADKDESAYIEPVALRLESLLTEPVIADVKKSLSKVQSPKVLAHKSRQHEHIASLRDSRPLPADLLVVRDKDKATDGTPIKVLAPPAPEVLARNAPIESKQISAPNILFINASIEKGAIIQPSIQSVKNDTPKPMITIEDDAPHLITIDDIQDARPVKSSHLAKKGSIYLKVED